MTPNHTVGVLGLGFWGTALSEHLARNGAKVAAWTIESEVVEGIAKSRHHPRCFPDHSLHPNISASTEIARALEPEIIIVALPVSAWRDVFGRDSNFQGKILVSVAKGLEPGSELTPLEFLKREHGLTQTVVLSGPSFAKDVMVGFPVGLVAGSADPKLSEAIAKLFSAGQLRVYTSTDPLGVELGGILKNVIAIAVGIADGLELGESTRASLVTRGLAEMTRLAEALSAKRETLYGLSGLGDLTMTATSDTSRNRTVGLRLGRGEPLEKIIQTLGSVAEGVYSTPHVVKLGRARGIELPISEGVLAVLEARSTPQEVLKLLVRRPLKAEFTP